MLVAENGPSALAPRRSGDLDDSCLGGVGSEVQRGTGLERSEKGGVFASWG